MHKLLPRLVWGTLCCVTQACGSSPSSSSDGGRSAASGGAVSVNGGAANGGTPVTAGGVSSGGSNSGGTSVGRGGNSSSSGSSGSGSSGSGSGGANAGGANAGGANAGGANAGGANAGGANACWSGATQMWSASDYVSRKWARWPMPNSQGSGLPHSMSYSTVADGVLDDVTGLIWQKTTRSAGSTWADAISYCQSLGAGWSLPTRIELTTIVRHDASGSKVDTSVFTFGAGAGWTWASTPWVVNQRKNLTGAAALAWFINFAVGDSNNSLSETNSSANARCVRIQPSLSLPAEHYTLGSAEVRDNFTCLTWQQASSGSAPQLTHDQAIQYCAGLALNGQKWRLPSVNELASIVDDVPSGDVSPAIDHAVFPDTSPDQKYWTSSAYGAPASAATFWTLNFKDGFTQHPDATTLGLARCVR